MSRGKVLIAAVAFVVASAASSSRADCGAAYESTQRLRLASKLREARAQAVTCADTRCQAWIKKECANWLDEIDKSIPSIVVQVIGRDGCDVASGTLRIDGTTGAQLDGSPIVLDPGAHRVMVEIDGAAPSEQNIVLAVGQKERRLTFSFAPPGVQCGMPSAPVAAPVQEKPTRRPVPTEAISAGALGVAALGIGGIMEIASMSKKSDFDRCAPRCDSSEIDGWKTRWVVADVLVGVGAVSLAIGAYLYFTRPEVRASAARPWVIRF